LHIQGAALDAKRKTDTAEQIRSRTDFIGKLFGDVGTNAANMNELIFNTLLGDRGSGMNLERQIEGLRGKTTLTAMAEAAGLKDQDIQNIETILRASQIDIDAAGPEEEKRKIRNQALETTRQYMLETGTAGQARRKAMQPYLTTARDILNKEGALDDQDKQELEVLRYATGLSTESLELFAAEDKAMGEEGSGNALKRFVSETKEKYGKLQNLKNAIGFFEGGIQDQTQRRQLIGASLANVASGRQDGFLQGDLLNALNTAMPDWKNAWKDAVGKGEEATNAFIDKIWAGAKQFVNQDERTFFVRSARDRGAWQNIQYGRDSAKFEAAEGKTRESLKETMGAAWYQTVGGDTQGTRGLRAHEDFMQSVVKDNGSLEDWMTRNFGDLTEDKRQHIRVQYENLLKEARANEPQSVEAVAGNMPIEDLLRTALGDGQIFHTLNATLERLISALIPLAPQKGN
jgi:hypothetical protein